MYAVIKNEYSVSQVFAMTFNTKFKLRSLKSRFKTKK